VIVPVESWNSVSQKALSFALSISSEVQVVHVEVEGSDGFAREWAKQVEQLYGRRTCPCPSWWCCARPTAL